MELNIALQDTSPVAGLMDPPPLPRWIVGIDLGTTNCSVASVDTQSPQLQVIPFFIEQLVDWNTIERRKTLPSFHYVPTQEDLNSCKSKWLKRPLKSDPYVVGVIARDVGGQAAGRQIASAKSWLCHRNADRTAAILPWHGEDEIDLISPVEASSRYLEHIRDAWNAAHLDHPLDSCDVVLTLPASFDEVARELTLQAAKLVGLKNLVLIEEPQAAFYAWLEKVQVASTTETIKQTASQESLPAWRNYIAPGQTVLVCDIGGGTTDFTLIRVKAEVSGAESLQKYGLHRVAVGQHLILGGDNLDVALTRVVEPLITGSNQKSLPIRQLEQLRNQCRRLKEKLLQDDAPEKESVAILGSGSRLISNVMTAVIEKQLVERVLIDGFFPQVALMDRPRENDTGLMEFGLQYANEPAITKHLAAFLWDHRWDGRLDIDRESLDDVRAAKPDWVLFNGGVLESSLIRKRIVDQINAWAPDSPPVGVLPADRLDIAVAIGAAYFGLAKRGIGVRISAKLARAYYLQISDSPRRAVCIMPGNAEPLDCFQLTDCPLILSVGVPIQLPLFVSSTNLIHRIGDVVEINELTMTPMPPLATVLKLDKSRKQHDIPVFIESSLSEIGTLELSLIESRDPQRSNESSEEDSPKVSLPSRWRLAFDLRGVSEEERKDSSSDYASQAVADQSVLMEAENLVKEAFTSKGDELSKTLVKRLSDLFGDTRENWPLATLRAIWRACLECDDLRKRSSVIEARWLNLVGYSLRPGYGSVADDWRVATTWRTIRGKLRHPGSSSEAMILWRRIAGGFTQGQQQAIYQDMQGNLKGILAGEPAKLRLISDIDEFLRMVGSLELLPASERKSIGITAITSLDNSKLKSYHDGILWMIARLGGRKPVYAPVNHVLSPEVIEIWIEKLLRRSDLAIAAHQRTLFSLSRKTGDRYRDISSATQSRVIDWLKKTAAPKSYLELVEFAGKLDASEQALIVGDTLPLGIRLR